MKFALALMKLLVVLLILILNVRGKRNNINIRNISLFENDFWNINDKQVESGQLKYLGRTTLFVKDENDNCVTFDFYSKNYRSLRITNRKYIVLEDFMAVDTISSLKLSAKDNEFLIFEFFFAEESIEDRFQFQKYRGKAQNHVTLKASAQEIDQNNNRHGVILEYDGLATRKSNIKDMLGRMVYLYIMKIDDYIAEINKNEPSADLEKNEFKANFDLFYFKEFPECLKNLKNFINEMSHINLMSNIDVSSSTNKNSKENEAVLKEDSKFIRSLRDKLISLDTNLPDKSEALKLLSNQYIDYLKNEMLHNRILFPISGQYNTKYYLDKINEIIYRLNGTRQQIVDVTNPDYDRFISGNAIKLFDIELKRLQVNALKNLSESEYIKKHFTALLGKNIETLDDYVIVEKIICDYVNMLAYLANFYRKKKDSKCSSYGYYTISPISTVNYNYQIIDGIEIKFINSIKFGEIKAFDKDEKEVEFSEGVHYFINSLNRFCCPLEVLKKMKIKKILLGSKDNKFTEEVKIEKYLAN